MCALPALPNSASPSIARSSSSIAAAGRRSRWLAKPPQRSAPIASSTDPRRPASARIRRHSRLRARRARPSPAPPPAAREVPRSKAGISSPSSDSAASAAASRASPLSTATASEVIAVSVFAPGPCAARAAPPGLQLGQVRGVGDAEEHADDPDRAQRQVAGPRARPAARRSAASTTSIASRRVLHEQQRAGEHDRRQCRARPGRSARRAPARAPRRPPVPRTNSAAAPSSSVSAERSSGAGGSACARCRCASAASGAPRSIAIAAASRSRSTTHASRARRREHQLRGDPLRARAELGQQPRRAGVLEPAPGGRQLEVDRVADERVDEAERLVGAQDLGPHERLDRLRGARPRRRSASAGDRGQPGLLAEHGDGARDGGGGRGQPREPQQHGARDRARADRAHRRGVLGVRRDVLGGQRGQQLAQQQRVAGGHVLAGGGERAVGLAEQRGRPCPPCRRSVSGRGWTATVAGSWPISPSSSSSASGSPVRIVVATSTGSPAMRRVEVGDEAQRGGVAPLQVVDAEHERAARGQRRGVVKSALSTANRPSPGPPSPNTARAAARRRVGRRDRLEELAHDAEAELALEHARRGRRGPRRPASSARSRRTPSRRVLPIPAGPSKASTPPSPAASRAARRRSRPARRRARAARPARRGRGAGAGASSRSWSATSSGPGTVPSSSRSRTRSSS